MASHRPPPPPPGGPPGDDAAEWKLFTELDLHEESEMLELSAFLQTLLDTFDEDDCGGKGSKRRFDSLHLLEVDHDDDDDDGPPPKSVEEIAAAAAGMTLRTSSSSSAERSRRAAAAAVARA